MTTPTLSSTVATSSSSVLFLSLPPYSIPSLPPSYSPDPSPGEECLERTPGVRAHLTGTYIKRCGCDAVGLSDHDLSATIPTYGRNSPIHGFVSLEDRETVSGIVLNIHGRIDVIVSGGGSHTTNLVSKSYTLWSSRTSRGTTTSTCPSVIPFSVSLPSEFRDHHGLPRALPPTSELTFAASRGLFFKTGYMLWVSIARSPSRRFKLLNTRNIISIDFKYAPRVRLSRPIQPVTEFLSDVKMMPEEFRQVVFPLVATSTVTPDMELHLFLPAIEIFDLKGTNPVPCSTHRACLCAARIRFRLEPQRRNGHHVNNNRKFGPAGHRRHQRTQRITQPRHWARKNAPPTAWGSNRTTREQRRKRLWTGKGSCAAVRM
ncbi:hypothetical protein MSAN_00865400 [Mycena sanguinolenta]|uniref:Uncharacterized protein n=1 Tax=Mycena sanguinolenta TaxID=230812 RepID=A0A8H6YZE5_9AGAR|nr:hypothetical protein MSAN_00865400 [Mycena sanguinolenta]